MTSSSADPYAPPHESTPPSGPSADASPERPPAPPSPVVAGILSLMQTGLGSFYAGRTNDWVLLALFDVVVLSLAFAAWGAARGAWMWPLVVSAAALVVRVAGAVVAVRGARAWGAGARRRPRWLACAACFVAVLAVSKGGRHLVRTQVVEGFRIPSQSMTPTLLAGDYVWAFKRGDSARARAGTIAVVSRDGQNFVKRIVGTGGDTIRIRGGALLRNGVVALAAEGVEDFGPETVRADHLFVVGDNLSNSQDSRHFGAVPSSAYVGEVGQVFVSWDESGLRWQRFGLRLP